MRLTQKILLRQPHVRNVIITNTSSETNKRIKISPITLFVIPKNGRMINSILNSEIEQGADKNGKFYKIYYGYQ
jgi:hypothetical protein